MPVYNNDLNKKSWRKTINKVILAVLLWIIAIYNIIAFGREGDARETLVTAFNQIQLNDMNASLEAFGYYGDVYLSESAKETFVRDIGYELGLNYCDVSTAYDGTLATTTLVKDGKYADTVIKMVTREENLSETVIESQQYIMIDINLGSNITAAMDYQSVLKELFEEMGIDGDVTVNLTGYRDGNSDLALRNMISDQLIEQMDAEIVAENRTNDLYTIYAYTNRVEDYIEVSGKKINLNISVYYEEADDRTYYYVATPIINNEY